MAWYAELRRRKWYCINGINMVNIYKHKLYDDWYNSLTNEQKQQLQEYRKKMKERKTREATEAVKNMLMMSAFVNSRLSMIWEHQFDNSELLGQDGG